PGAAAGAPQATDAPDHAIVPEGKEDDFYSANAREYWVSGSSTVTIEDDLATATAAAKLQRATQLVSLKRVAIGWFLDVYLTDKEDDDKNKSYGGFGALTRFGSDESSALRPVDGKTFAFDFRVQV